MSDENQTSQEETEEEKAIPEKEEAEAEKPSTEEEAKTEEQTQETGEEADADDAHVEQPAAPDYKEKFQQSSSEAMILNSKYKNLESTLKKLTSEDTPTEAEILEEYPEFPKLDATSQRFALNQVATMKRQRRHDLKFAEQDAEKKWKDDLKTLTRQDDYSALKGDQEFESFVFDNPKHRGVDLQVLADAYLVRKGKKAPTDAPAPTAPKEPIKPGLPRGSGGPRGPQPSKKLTIEQAALLRKTNDKEYRKQVVAGNVEENI